jgi:hypothetical protein
VILWAMLRQNQPWRALAPPPPPPNDPLELCVTW